MQVKWSLQLKRTNAEWQRRVIARLLKEDTGRHFLDSGGAYGRHHERNAIKTDEQLTGWDYSLVVRPTHFEVSLNVAHWMYEAFDFDREHTTKLMEFSRSKKFRQEDWTDCLNAYIESVDGCFLRSKSGNTCNYQTFLTQSVNYTGIDLPDRCGDYYAIRIHQGCDVRGGYGEYVIAEGTDLMFQFSNATLACRNGHRFSTDDTYRWYPDFECWGGNCYTDDDLKIASNAHTWWLQCPECRCKLEVGP